MNKTPLEILYDSLIDAGWEKFRPPHENCYSRGNKQFMTWRKDGVAIATRAAQTLMANRGCVELYDGDPHEVTIEVFFVENASRRQGLATATLAEITRLADLAGITFYIEPTPLEKGQIEKEDLVAMYTIAGFKPQDPGNWVLRRTPRKR